MILIMIGLGFLCEKKILERLRRRTTFASTCILMKTSWLFQFTFQIKNFKTDRFVACNWWKQVTLCVHQRFSRIYVSQKRRIKSKNTFANVAYSVLVVKMCWQSIKKFVCLSINGAKSVILEKETTEFKNYFKQILAKLILILSLT